MSYSNQFAPNAYKFGGPSTADEGVISGSFFIGEGRIRIEMSRPDTGDAVFIDQQYNFNGELDSEEGEHALSDLAQRILESVQDGMSLDDVLNDEGVAYDVLGKGAELLGIEWDPEENGTITVWSPTGGWRQAEKRLTQGWKRVLN